MAQPGTIMTGPMGANVGIPMMTTIITSAPSQMLNQAPKDSLIRAEFRYLEYLVFTSKFLNFVQFGPIILTDLKIIFCITSLGITCVLI